MTGSAVTSKGTVPSACFTAMRLGGKSVDSVGNAVTRMILGDTTSSRTIFAGPCAGVTEMPVAVFTKCFGSSWRAHAATTAKASNAEVRNNVIVMRELSVSRETHAQNLRRAGEVESPIGLIPVPDAQEFPRAVLVHALFHARELHLLAMRLVRRPELHACVIPGHEKLI